MKLNTDETIDLGMVLKRTCLSDRTNVKIALNHIIIEDDYLICFYQLHFVYTAQFCIINYSFPVKEKFLFVCVRVLVFTYKYTYLPTE